MIGGGARTVFDDEWLAELFFAVHCSMQPLSVQAMSDYQPQIAAVNASRPLRLLLSQQHTDS
jgi:hypothetical protein